MLSPWGNKETSWGKQAIPEGFTQPRKGHEVCWSLGVGNRERDL